MGDRQFNEMDLRYLKSLRAPMDDETFQRMYFAKRDVWERMHPSGALPNATLLDLVQDSEERIAKQSLVAKPVKKVEKVA